MRRATLISVAALAAGAVADKAVHTPTSVKAPFVEQFDVGWDSRWNPSQATKETDQGEQFSYVGQWSVEEPTVYPGLEGDAGLVAKNKAAHHAISAQFDEVVDTKGEKALVVQYEVKLQEGLDCGGAYLKLLSESANGVQAEEFSDKTPYTIMFGPDKCGATNKVHFIFKHTNPLTGEVEEKHLKSPPLMKNSKISTLYTLIVNPDNTFNILINDESVKTGSLLEDFNPPVNPPAEIDDPEDKKPEDWVEEAKIADPDAVKPEDWDEDAPAEIEDDEAEMPEGWLETETQTVPDPAAEKPEEWDAEEDGDWVPPLIANPVCEDAPGCGPWKRPLKANPEYKGKWYAPLIDNPLYKGIWAPRKIANPDYYEDKQPSKFNPISGVGFEIWTMSPSILFDNIYVGYSPEDAKALAAETFHVKRPLEEALEKAALDKNVGDDKAAAAGDWKADPVKFARAKLNEFIAHAKLDPVEAIKAKPETAGALGFALATLFGLLGLLFGLIGGTRKPAAKPIAAKKTDGKTPEGAKETAAAGGSVVPAADKAKPGVTQRKGQAKADE